MKRLKFPDPIACAVAVDPSGHIEISDFVRRFVLPRPVFRERGNAELVLEICAWLDAPGNCLTDAAHELLTRELAFPGHDLRWEMVRVVAEIQRWLASATNESEGR